MAEYNEYLSAYPVDVLLEKLEGLDFDWASEKLDVGAGYKLKVRGLLEDHLRYAYNSVYGKDIDEIPVVHKFRPDDEMLYAVCLSDMDYIAHHEDGCFVRLV